MKSLYAVEGDGPPRELTCPNAVMALLLALLVVCWSCHVYGCNSGRPKRSEGRQDSQLVSACMERRESGSKTPTSQFQAEVEKATKLVGCRVVALSDVSDLTGPSDVETISDVETTDSDTFQYALHMQVERQHGLRSGGEWRTGE